MDELGIDRELLLQTFLAEAEETLVQMEQGLVALEARPGDDELLHAVFRAAHTLKGSSGLVGLDSVGELAHDVEDVLARLRSRALEVSDALVTLLLRSVDVLRSAVADGAAGRTEASEAVAAFRSELASAAAGGGPGARSAGGAAPSDETRGLPHQAAAGRSLRVDVAKLDRMLDLSGEIAIARGRIAEMLERGSATPQEVLEAHRESDRLYLDLQELIMKARMVPIGPAFHQHVRTIRDVASARGKHVRLVVEGEDVEVDTAVVEYVRDPLTHMVRNALDHGIEPPEVRRERGKDPVGTLTLRAFHEAGSMVLQVIDDGGGLDRRRIAEKAVALGLAQGEARLSDEELARVLFEPGFSTAETVTDISGRGVGMDVVRRNVEALRGSVSIASEPGEGTAVTIRVPLTLAIVQGFKVAIADEIYILPLEAVVECIELPAEQTEADTPLGVVNLRGKPLPYLRLRHLLQIPGERPERENVVVVQSGSLVAGLTVDVLHGESSTVIKPLGTMFKGLPGIAGSSILGNGRVALMLDIPGLLREIMRRTAREAAAA